MKPTAKDDVKHKEPKVIFTIFLFCVCFVLCALIFFRSSVIAGSSCDSWQGLELDNL